MLTEQLTDQQFLCLMVGILSLAIAGLLTAIIWPLDDAPSTGCFSEQLNRITPRAPAHDPLRRSFARRERPQASLMRTPIVIVSILPAFTALGLASAVAIAQLRSRMIGRRLLATPADPSDLSFVAASAGALRRSADGGRAKPSCSAAVRNPEGDA